MKSLAMFLAVAIGAVAGVAATQDVNASRVTLSGDVVRYDAGKTIVVRGLDGHEVTYTIAPALPVPAGVGVGRRVTIVTEPSETGAVLVTRITAEAAPGGAITTTAEKSGASSPGEAKSQITSTLGTVSAYEPGRTITILRPNATTVTYTIDASSAIPTGLSTGRRVVIRTITRPGVEQPVVRKVSYSRTTKKTTVQ
ncbi:MAG TPA: hypothetical protein VFW81_03115 [Thermoanaerobaculia bacterium]|nr:hypothetical protein [Thermoanaerobaculia bacterium]